MKATPIAAIALLLVVAALSGCVSFSMFTTHCYYDEEAIEGSGQGGVRFDLIRLGASSKYESPAAPMPPTAMEDNFRIFGERMKGFEDKIQRFHGKAGQAN